MICFDCGADFVIESDREIVNFCPFCGYEIGGTANAFEDEIETNDVEGKQSFS